MKAWYIGSGKPKSLATEQKKEDLGIVAAAV